MTGFFIMENEKKIQKNYEELKKKSDKTEKFIRLVNDLNIDDKDVPKTEKGLQTKAKELMDRLSKKLEKEEVKEVKVEKKVKKQKNNKKY